MSTEVLGWDAWAGDSGIKHANAVELGGTPESAVARAMERVQKMESQVARVAPRRFRSEEETHPPAGSSDSQLLGIALVGRNSWTQGHTEICGPCCFCAAQPRSRGSPAALGPCCGRGPRGQRRAARAANDLAEAAWLLAAVVELHPADVLADEVAVVPVELDCLAHPVGGGLGYANTRPDGPVLGGSRSPYRTRVNG